MSVTVDPEEVLTFQPPYDGIQKKTVTIGNDGQLPVAFKVKTTSPKQYCVKPNAGRIEPGATKEVLIELQPIKDIATYPGRDKFLIQSCPIALDNLTPVGELWPALERDQKDSLVERKLRCAFDMPDGTARQPTSPITGSSNGGNYSAAMSSPSRENDDVRSLERRLKEALLMLEKNQGENQRLKTELTTFKSGDMTLRQRREADQFAMSSGGSQDPWTTPREETSSKFSATFVIIVAILAFIFGIYIH